MNKVITNDRTANDCETVRFENPALQQGFTIIQNAVLLNPDLSDAAVRLYGVLGHYARQDGSCFPGQTRLAKDMGKAPRTVRSHLTELERAGLLEVVRRGQSKTNLYVLKDPRIPQSDADRPDSATHNSDRPDSATPDRPDSAYKEKAADEQTELVTPPTPPAIAERLTVAKASNSKLVVDHPAINRALADATKRGLADVEDHAIDCIEWLGAQRQRRVVAATMRTWFRRAEPQNATTGNGRRNGTKAQRQDQRIKQALEVALAP